MYKTAWFCSHCKQELTDNQRMYSDGMCPKCGFKHENAASIVNTIKRSYLLVKIPSGKWWKPDAKVRQFK